MNIMAIKVGVSNPLSRSFHFYCPMGKIQTGLIVLATGAVAYVGYKAYTGTVGRLLGIKDGLTGSITDAAAAIDARSQARQESFFEATGKLIAAGARYSSNAVGFQGIIDAQREKAREERKDRERKDAYLDTQSNPLIDSRGEPRKYNFNSDMLLTTRKIGDTTFPVIKGTTTPFLTQETAPNQFDSVGYGDAERVRQISFIGGLFDAQDKEAERIANSTSIVPMDLFNSLSTTVTSEYALAAKEQSVFNETQKRTMGDDVINTDGSFNYAYAQSVGWGNNI